MGTSSSSLRTTPAAGVQLGFISRTGHRVGIGADNVLALFDAIRTTSP